MLAAGLTFLVTLRNGFAWDDANRIAAFAAGDTRPAAFLASGRGLAYSFHLLDYRLWGANAAGFHFTNLLLHSLATGLVALLALDLTRSARIGLLCGLLFAVHPVHVEAVASFCNRKDILALIFSLLCLYMGRRRSPRAPVVALTCFALALYAKEVASVALPALLLAAEEFLPRGATPDGARRRWRGPIIVASVLALAAVGWFWREIVGAFASTRIAALNEGHLTSYGEVLGNSLAAVPRVVQLFALPTVLSADYPLWQPGNGYVAVVLGAVLVVAGGVATLVLLRRWPVAGFGLLWAMVMYLPTSNVVPLVGIYAAERYLYVPSFGVCLLVAAALDRWARNRPARDAPEVVAVAALLVLMGAGRSVARAGDWHDTGSLAWASIAQGVETARLHHNLGVAQWAEGRRQEALFHLKRGVQLDPTSLPTRRVLAVSLMFAGDVAQAACQCDTILRNEPGDSGCHFIRAQAGLARGDTASAIHDLRLATASDSGNALASTVLASLLVRCPDPTGGEIEAALQLSNRALRSRLTPAEELLALETRRRALERSRGAALAGGRW